MLRKPHRKYRFKASYRETQPWAVLALKRDNYLCQDCKVENLDLIVHHVDESRKNGWRSMNNNLDNLITLCRKCHAVRHGYSFQNIKYPLIKELRDNGKTYQEIGDYLGISRQRVHQIIKQNTP